MRMSVTSRLAVVATVLAAAFAAVSATPATAIRTAKLPSRFVGTWTRNITAADWKRADSANFGTGLFTMVVSASGDVQIVDFYATFSPLPGGRLAISGVPVCGKATGLYRWKIAARRLTLTKLRDRCGPEVGLFAGIWKRK